MAVLNRLQIREPCCNREGGGCEAFVQASEFM